LTYIIRAHDGSIDAKDDSAAAFYRHFGFIDLSGEPDRLLMPAAAFCR